MTYLLCLIGFAAVAAADFPSLIKSKKPRELVIYSVIFVLVLTFAIMVITDGNMKSTIKVAQSFYRDFLHLSFKKG